MSDLFSLAGKTALVTGSSRGIGRAITLGFAAQGADVAVHYSSLKPDAQSAVEQASAFGSNAHMFAANFSEPDAARRLFSQVVQVFGKLDILVLNVSVQVRRPWTEVTHSEFDLQVDTNLRASMEMMQLAIPSMVERRWGRVLTVGSVQQFRPHPEMLVYAATKSAQLNMAMNIGRQVAPYGVTVNNLCPGTIETDRNSEALADAAYRSRVLSHSHANVWTA